MFTVYYLLLVAAAILFSVQFVFNQQFQIRQGADADSSLTFSVYAYFCMAVLMVLLNRFRLHCSWITLAIAGAYAVTLVVFSFSSVKAFASVSLSFYSLFSMLGGMLLPFLYGLVFCGEPLTVGKGVGCGLVLVALLLTLRQPSFSVRGLICCLICFVCNGMVGVFSKMHQIYAPAVDNGSFLTLTYLLAAALAFVILAFRRRIGALRIRGISVMFTAGYALCSGTAGLLSLIALQNVPASVQYPFITGGVIVLSAVVGWLQKEKLSVRGVLSVAVALAASIIVIL